jgi:hypothetical protein
MHKIPVMVQDNEQGVKNNGNHPEPICMVFIDIFELLRVKDLMTEYF